jgi:hypothetical protein
MCDYGKVSRLRAILTFPKDSPTENVCDRPFEIQNQVAQNQEKGGDY